MSKKLYFIDSKRVAHFITEAETLKECTIARREDMTRRGFNLDNCYYIRSWFADYDGRPGQWIDFGSWSCFYFIEGATIEDNMKEDHEL
jgi:hypothetical protein